MLEGWEAVEETPTYMGKGRTVYFIRVHCVSGRIVEDARS
jgi:hypothetical protein